MSAIHTLVSVLLGHITKHKRLRKAFHWCKLHVQPLQVLFQNHIARVWRERDEVPALEVTNELVKSSSRAAEAAFMSDIQDLQADEMDFGDFVTDRGEEAEVEFLSEPWPQYNEKDTTRPFYPVCVGERLNGRYLVEHKLGHGGFSTVWMAHDTEEEKDVALKIFSLDGSARNETRIQTEIKKRVQDKSHLVVAMDTFTLPRESIESYHIVHVLPLMGPCVVWEVTNQLSLAVRMSAACQLLNAVAALHKSGIVHRDITGGNCMWGISSTSGLDRATKYAKLTRPLKVPIRDVELWKKGELVQPAEIPVEMRTDDFFLADFGLSTKPGDPTFDTPQGFPPSEYCSPERLHQQKPTFACDMWSYMVVFSQLYLGFAPIHPSAEGGLLADLCNLFGQMPREWKGLSVGLPWEDSLYEGGDESPPNDPLGARIARRRPDVDQDERDLAERIMRKVFVYSPEKRPSATQLLEDNDFKALMRKYGCEF